MEFLYFVCGAAVLVAGIGYIIIRQEKVRQKQLDDLKAQYKNAMASGNKADALAAGRAYYGAVRNGPLTIYDEQALTNDLSTM